MTTPVPQKKSGLSLWKLFRWFVLCALAVVIFLMSKKPPAVAEVAAPEVLKQRSAELETKLADLEQAHQRGEPAEARFSSEEINAAFQRAGQAQPESASQPESAGAPAAVPAASAGGSDPGPAASEAAPEIRTTLVAFRGDYATAQFVVRAPGGKDLYLTISGKIKAVDGYANLEFTEARIGDMPVPISLLNARLQEKLQEPETRAKLKLPDFVSDIRVENGELVMIEK